MGLDVTLWGVRGSLPAPNLPSYNVSKIKKIFSRYEEVRDSQSFDEFAKTLTPSEFGGYGGHTSCTEVISGKHQLIIDGGSGIRKLGENMMRGPCGMGKGEVHILMTHFHWDHLIGLPFFIPIFVPGNKIHFYSVQPELEEAIRLVFKKPFFPVRFEDLGSKIFFHQIKARQPIEFGDFKYAAYQLDHPDPCYGFRFEKNGTAFGYSVDNEGTRISRKDLGEDLKLYQDIDLLVYDAQYTLVETTERVNWGHSAATLGLDIAVREKIRRVLFVHHDPSASDERLAEAEKQTLEYYNARQTLALDRKEDFFEVDWSFAPEGTTFRV